jgi:hypothetical protein
MKDIMAEVAACPTPGDVLSHFRSHGAEYDLVASATALQRVHTLAATTSQRKRAAVAKVDLDALVVSTTDAVGSALTHLERTNGPPSTRGAGAAPQSPVPSRHELRSIVAAAFSLARLNRLPPRIADSVSCVCRHRDGYRMARPICDDEIPPPPPLATPARARS